MRFPGVFIVGLSAIASLAAQPKLSLERLEFHQYEDGPPLDAGYEFLPGETVWFSARMPGFRTQPEGDRRHVKLTWRLQITDPAGVLIEKPRDGSIDEHLLPEDKEWQPKILANFQIPAFGVGGSYKIQLAAKDELAEVEASRTLEFPVKGPEILPSDTLVIRNFRFFRNEDDALALQPAVYRPGMMLWAKFDILGFKLGDNNRFDVGYGLAVLGPDGKELFAQPEAADQAKESFYPQRWVPGSLSLSLDPNVAPATYTLAVRVKDKLSGETTELREPFQVR